MIESTRSNATQAILLDAGGLVEPNVVETSRDTLAIQLEVLDVMGYDAVNVIPHDLKVMNASAYTPQHMALVSANLMNKLPKVRPWVEVAKGERRIAVIGSYFPPHPDYSDPVPAITETLKEIPASTSAIILLAYGNPEEIQTKVRDLTRLSLVVVAGGRTQAPLNDTTSPRLVTTMAKGLNLTGTWFRDDGGHLRPLDAFSNELGLSIVGDARIEDMITTRTRERAKTRKLEQNSQTNQQYLHMTPQEFINAYSKEQRQ